MVGKVGKGLNLHDEMNLPHCHCVGNSVMPASQILLVADLRSLFIIHHPSLAILGGSQGSVAIKKSNFETWVKGRTNDLVFKLDLYTT